MRINLDMGHVLSGAVGCGRREQDCTNTANVTVQQGNSGLSSDWVRRLQEECNRQGFSNQVVEGVPGANTLAGGPTLKYGAKGNITKLLQERLVELGYDINGIDRIFGIGTLRAVKKFQLDRGLIMVLWVKVYGMNY